MLGRRAALLLLAASCAACGGTAGLGPYKGAPVVLISVDTLRADHLPAYGYKAGSTPNIDRLARDGVLFEDVYSHCPLTLPAHASLLTGLLPPHHGVHDNLGFTLKADRRTLATRLKAAGYHTGGAVSAFVLRRQTGIAQGFDFYEDALEIEGSGESMAGVQRDGGVAVEALLGWIQRQSGAPFFAFLHLYEPHSPYTPPERHKQPLPYDGDIAYADELVGRFLDGLQASGVADRALVVFTSDHGEGLNDHGEEEHGIFLYREAVHVPLILRLPRKANAGVRISGPVSQADIAPTLLEFVGAAADGMDGRSLRAAIQKRASDGQAVYSETQYSRLHFGWSALYAASDARYRYIRAPRAELFDLQHDPKEKENLVGARATTATAMNAWLERQIGASQEAKASDVDTETREKLQALGYVGLAAAPLSKTAELPDPKDKIASYEDLRRALRLRRDGKDAEAVALFRKIVAENPLMLDAWETLGLTLMRMDRKPEAMAALVKALEIEPSRAETNLTLAKAYALDGKTELARRHAEIASQKDPGVGYETLALLMLDRGRVDEATAFARRSLAADPSSFMSRFVLGVAAQRAGRCQEAVTEFRAAIDAKERTKQTVVRNLHSNLADCLARLGRESEAEAEFKKELEAIPASAEARARLAMLYRSQGRDNESRDVMSGLIAAQPKPNAEAYWTVVRTLAVLGDAEAAQDWAKKARAAFPDDARFRRPPTN